MTDPKDFIQAGFSVIDKDAAPHAENADNKLIAFLKEHYPHTVRGGEVKLGDLKAALGLPVDDKTNGYGLNFVGRNFARAKYGQATTKTVRLNPSMSKHIDTTQNLVLKGDNLDSLKILKSHYSGKIKCIYIDPPYNTTSDEFVYPDRFNKEEAEVLGLVNLSEADYARMDFSFKTKKSHNGWLAFMYPRLLLARDLLRKDGVIFISIDDNEQANLKLLCDEIFGEENFVANVLWQKKYSVSNDDPGIAAMHDYILTYQKSVDFQRNLLPRTEKQLSRYKNPDNDPRGNWASGEYVSSKTKDERPTLWYPIKHPKTGLDIWPDENAVWRYSLEEHNKLVAENRLYWGADLSYEKPRIKRFLSEIQDGTVPSTWWVFEDVGHNDEAQKETANLIGKKIFNTPKPIRLLSRILGLSMGERDIALDFFAGSGTTGHAVMQLNAEDGGNRKFILCQIDEPIKEDKPAYQFCVDKHLPPLISSITIERLKRAGDKIAAEVEAHNSKSGLFETDKKPMPDMGFKVFDAVDAPRLQWDEVTGQIEVVENPLDGDNEAHAALSRIYHMIFTVGLDEPTQTPEAVIDKAVYKIGSNYYITNAERISTEDFSSTVKAALKHGKVFIDGWTASLNGTLQNFKDDVKIVF